MFAAGLCAVLVAGSWGPLGARWCSQVLWVLLRWSCIPVQGHEVLTSLFCTLVSHNIKYPYLQDWAGKIVLVISPFKLCCFVICSCCCCCSESACSRYFWTCLHFLMINRLVAHSFATCFLQHTKTILLFQTGG